MSDQELPDSIKSGTFLMVCSGECYHTEIVSGERLLERMAAAMFGENKHEWPNDQLEQYALDLANMDNWNQDQDVGPTEYDEDIGETDRIRLIRLINP